MAKKEEWMGEISIQKYLTEIKSDLKKLQSDMIQVKLALGIDNPVLPSQDQIDIEFEKMEDDYWEAFDE